jgi:hypothetical protein
MPLLLCTLLLFAPFDDPASDDPTPEEESAAQLAKVRRIYIDVLTGGDVALSNSLSRKTKTRPTQP